MMFNGGVAKARKVDGLSAALPLREAAARTLRVRADELFGHLAVAGPEPGADAVYDVRVATRRLCATLEVYRPCLAPKAQRRALREVKALAAALGDRRDADAQLQALDRFAGAMKEADRPGVEAFAARVASERDAGAPALSAALREVRASGLHERLLDLAERA